MNIVGHVFWLEYWYQTQGLLLVIGQNIAEICLGLLVVSLSAGIWCANVGQSAERRNVLARHISALPVSEGSPYFPPLKRHLYMKISQLTIT
jgi:hypothetical protein